MPGGGAKHKVRYESTKGSHILHFSSEHTEHLKHGRRRSSQRNRRTRPSPTLFSDAARLKKNRTVAANFIEVFILRSIPSTISNSTFF